MDGFVKKVKGSYTVEMAMISGIWLLVILAALLLILGSYRRVYDTSFCSETAVYGSTEAVERTGSGLDRAAQRLKGQEDIYTVSGGKKEIIVSFKNKTEIPYGNLEWKWSGSVKRKVIKPVQFIEKVQKSRRFWNNVTG